MYVQKCKNYVKKAAQLNFFIILFLSALYVVGRFKLRKCHGNLLKIGSFIICNKKISQTFFFKITEMMVMNIMASKNWELRDLKIVHILPLILCKIVKNLFLNGRSTSLNKNIFFN